MTEHTEVTKFTLDIVSAFVALGSLMKILPEISALVAIVWYCIRIWESKTVQGWLGRKEQDNG